MVTGRLTVMTTGGVEAEAAKLPLAAKVAVTLSVPMGRSISATAEPLVRVAVTGVTTVVLPAAVYEKATVPVGVPAFEVTVAVNLTGTPRVVEDVAALRVVEVVAGVMVRLDAVEVEPAFRPSPL